MKGYLGLPQVHLMVSILLSYRVVLCRHPVLAVQISLSARRKKSPPHLLHQLRLLLGRAELEELLYDVVAEDVGHERVCVRRDLLQGYKTITRLHL